MMLSACVLGLTDKIFTQSVAELHTVLAKPIPKKQSGYSVWSSWMNFMKGAPDKPKTAFADSNKLEPVSSSSSSLELSHSQAQGEPLVEVHQINMQAEPAPSLQEDIAHEIVAPVEQGEGLSLPTNLAVKQLSIDDRRAELIGQGHDRYKSDDIYALKASINTLALGNARTVLVDFSQPSAKQQEALNAIQDLDVRVALIDSFVTDAGRGVYTTLQNSMAIFDSVATNRDVQSNRVVREQAVNNLLQGRAELGVAYQRSLSLLASTAKKSEMSAAQAKIQNRLSSKTANQIFANAKTVSGYKDFMQQLKNNSSTQEQLHSFLEKELQLQSGDLSALVLKPAVARKLSELYQAIDLVGQKEKASSFFSFSSQGAAKQTAKLLETLKTGILLLDPVVSTSLQDELLMLSTDKQSILLTMHVDFVYTTMGRAVRELQAQS